MAVCEQEAPKAPAPIAQALALGLCVFLSGASVMIYQFMVVRILARDFGGALDVWASVIAVCLAGLSIGYWFGGKLADRFRSWKVLGLTLALGGLSGAFVEVLANRAGDALIQIDFALTWHPYMAAFASCFLPNVILGSVLPQTIKLATKQLEKVGATAGRIAALSEVGSITGVVLTAQVLMMYVGVRESLYLTSGVLIAVGLILSQAGRWLAPAAALLVLAWSPPAQARIVLEEYSAYHHIIVEDTDTHRLLRFNRDIQTTMSLSDPYTGGFEYTHFFHTPVLFNPTIDRALFIGLGGGTGPKDFLNHYRDMQVDVVEIDPRIVEIAREYFHLPEHPRLNIVVQDGRAYLRRARDSYGAIIVDAYASGGPYGAYLPYHLATREFFELVRERLEPGGSLVFNAVGAHGGMNANVIRDVTTTLRHVFEHVYVFEAHTSINTVFVAVKSAGAADGQHWPNGPWTRHLMGGAELRAMAERLMEEGIIRMPAFNMRVAQFSRAHRHTRDGNVLTDNHAPVDIGGGRR